VASSTISVDFIDSFQSLSVFTDEVSPQLSDGVGMGYFDDDDHWVTDNVGTDEACYVFSDITSSSADGVSHPDFKSVGCSCISSRGR